MMWLLSYGYTLRARDHGKGKISQAEKCVTRFTKGVIVCAGIQVTLRATRASLRKRLLAACGGSLLNKQHAESFLYTNIPGVSGRLAVLGNKPILFLQVLF